MVKNIFKNIFFVALISILSIGFVNAQEIRENESFVINSFKIDIEGVVSTPLGDLAKIPGVLEITKVSSTESKCYNTEKHEIVCKTNHLGSGGNVLCWGNNQLNRCDVSTDNLRQIDYPSEIKIHTKNKDDEIDILAWSWGKNSFEDPDSSDKDQSRVVWLVNSLNQESNDFEKIEIKYSKDLSLFVYGSIPIEENNLYFVTINLETNISDFLDLDSDGDSIPDIVESIEDFDKINNIQEEKKIESVLSKEDSKKALDGFSLIINNIKVNLEKCKTNVCRQVSLNADKRHKLVSQAQEDLENSPRYIKEIQSIVNEDISSLKRCETDICKQVLLQEEELLLLVNSYIKSYVGGSDCDDINCDVKPPIKSDLNGDGVQNIVKGERISLVGFGDFSVSKISTSNNPLFESNTVEGISLLYEPQTALQITGGGTGKVTFKTLEEINCPENKCSTTAVEINIENNSHVALFFEQGFATQENLLSVEDKTISLGIGASKCSQEQNEIHCINENEDFLVVAFDKEAEVVCQLDEDSKVYSWSISSTQEQKIDNNNQIYCWGENKRGEKVEVVFNYNDSSYIQKLDNSINRDPLNASWCENPPCEDPVSDIPNEITLEQARELALKCPNGECRELIAERCEDDVCRETIRKEGVIHRDIALARAFITDTTGSMGGTITAVKRAIPSEWSQEDKEEIAKYIQNLTNLTREDLALVLAYQNSNNQQVREVRYNQETNKVEIDHEQEVKLFGFISLNVQAKTIIDSELNEDTQLPWWSFLATKDKKPKFKAGAELSKSVN